MVVAARANGLRPIDGPFGDFQDPDGYRAAAKRAAVLGCEGKWAIHPSQVALANEVMSPSTEEVDKANRILAAMAEAEAAGKGAVSLDGRLIELCLDPPGRGAGGKGPPNRRVTFWARNLLGSRPFFRDHTLCQPGRQLARDTRQSPPRSL